MRSATAICVFLALAGRAGADQALNPNAIWSGEKGSFVAGAGGALLRSRPGDSERTRLASPVTVDLFGVFGDGQSVVAVGEGGTILRSSDGDRFAQVSSPTDKDLAKVWGASGTFFAVGTVGTILRSSDGGATWKLLESKSEIPLWGVWGRSTTEVFAVGDSGTILHTRDGGATWKEEKSGVDPLLAAIWSAADGELFAVGGGGKIIHSRDGEKWEELVSPTEKYLKALWGSSASDLWVVGNAGTILHSSDGKSFQLSTEGVADLLGIAGNPGEKPQIVGYTRAPRGLFYADAALNILGIFLFLGLIAIVKPPKHVPSPNAGGETPTG